MNTNEQEFKISELPKIFKRRKNIFYLTFIITIILSILYVLMLNNVYLAENLIQYKSKSTSSSLSQYAGLASTLGIPISTEDYVGGVSDEIQKMKSDYILGKIVDDLNMVENANNNKNIIAKIRNITYTKRDFINSLKNKIKIELIDGTNFAKISYESSNPTFAASVVNMVYENYLTYDKELETKNSNETINQVNSVFSDVENQYNELTKKLYDYKMKNKIGNDNIPTELLNYYQTTYLELLNMDQKKQQLENTIDSIEKMFNNSSTDLKEFLIISNNSSLSSLKNTLINSKIELETLKINQPNSPKIEALETTISITQNELKTQQEKILSDKLVFLSSADKSLFQKYIETKNQLDFFDINKQVYEKILQTIDNEITKNSPVIYQYLQMLKDEKILESKYNMFYTTLEQEKLKKILYIDKFNLIENAYIPEKPFGPNKKKILIIGFGLGLILGIVFMFFTDAFDKKIRSVNDFENSFSLIDINIFTKKDAEKIYNYIYKNNLKKVALIIDKSSKHQKTILDNLKYLTAEVDPEREIYEPSDDSGLKNKIDNFEKLKEKEKAIVVFKSIESPSYILYEEHMESKILIIEEGYTDIEFIDSTLKKVPNIVKVYLKPSRK